MRRVWFWERDHVRPLRQLRHSDRIMRGWIQHCQHLPLDKFHVDCCGSMRRQAVVLGRRHHSCLWRRPLQRSRQGTHCHGVVFEHRCGRDRDGVPLTKSHYRVDTFDVTRCLAQPSVRGRSPRAAASPSAALHSGQARSSLPSSTRRMEPHPAHALRASHHRRAMRQTPSALSPPRALAAGAAASRQRRRTLAASTPVQERQKNSSLWRLARVRTHAFVLLLLLRAHPGTSDTRAATCGTAVESSTLPLSCDAGSRISSVAFANFGTPTGTCPASFAVNPSCATLTSGAVASTACLGLPSCSLTATIAAFGGTDPCNGVGKSVAAAVTCSNPSEMRIRSSRKHFSHATRRCPPVCAACGTLGENKYLSLSCAPAGATITAVTFASYGTPNGSCAAGFTIVPSCHSASSLSVVTSACVGLQTCAVATNYLNFGADPCNGVAKTLAASVTCTGNSTFECCQCQAPYHRRRLTPSSQPFAAMQPSTPH